MWRVRFNTWLGYMFNKVTLGYFEMYVTRWYNRKYPHIH